PRSSALPSALQGAQEGLCDTWECGNKKNARKLRTLIERSGNEKGKWERVVVRRKVKGKKNENRG
ncbi:MAG TPA: hypothetical protein PKU94_08875, partial [Candidatus Hydrothermia bacterium]|nr:hypothetical protein [Candidatus Hydrothermia bacterium]